MAAVTSSPPGIAVIIPVLNGVTTLGEQLDAVLAQSVNKQFHVIVVDNGSTDDTRGVIASYAERDDRVWFVDGSTVPRNAAAAKNLGVQSTSAPRIAFCDADDVVQPGWLAALDSGLDAADAVAGRLERHSLNPHIDPRDVPLYVDRYNVFGYAGLPGGNFGIHRDVYLLLGGLSDQPQYAEDSEFSIRLGRAGRTVHYQPTALVAIRLRTGAITSFRHARASYRAHHVLRSTCGLPTPTVRRALRGTAGRLRWLMVHAHYLLDARRRLAWMRTAALLVARFDDVKRNLFPG